VERTCTVYTLTEAKEAVIELQLCSNCPSSRRRYIGPETRDIGLFNYNNSVLFSHELLDDFMSGAVSSETPFVAFVSVMRRRYQWSEKPFVGEDLFRTVWFSYTRLIQFENDMWCESCGEAPETIIFDGTATAFQTKHLLNCLEPPTAVVKERCEHRDAVQYVTGQQCFPDVTLRKGIKQCLKGIGERDSVVAKREYRNTVKEVHEWLSEINKHLASLFDKQVAKAGLEFRAPTSTYKRLFEQERLFIDCMRSYN
jgi:hypothetical protein